MKSNTEPEQGKFNTFQGTVRTVLKDVFKRKQLIPKKHKFDSSHLLK
jgi:hypothetical protein